MTRSAKGSPLATWCVKCTERASVTAKPLKGSALNAVPAALIRVRRRNGAVITDLKHG
jgi:hypothetical protein